MFRLSSYYVTVTDRNGGGASILDGNSLRPGDLDDLDPRTRELVLRRQRDLGAAYRLFYKHPVELVRGRGARVWDAQGREYLDCYNNVPSLGHAHPAVVGAVSDQIARLSTHSRYLHEPLLDFADDLLSTMPGIDQLMLVCTGSEANDLALRVGREATGGNAYIATREAYHGNTALVSAHSPSLAGSEPQDLHLRVVAPPDTYLAGSSEVAGATFTADVAAAIDDIERAGDRLAGIILDTSFSSDGIFFGHLGMIAPAIELVRARGGIVIADEVQPGWARSGEAFWGFQRHGLTPDIVTTGKPMGNGFPVAAMAARREVLEPFASRRPYFNTFGGNPVAVAAAQAVLTTIRTEHLQDHAKTVGDAMRTELRGLMGAHPVIGDVRGAGLYTGLELVEDVETKAPATGLALALLEQLRERGVLTSVCGPANSILKLRPPLAFAPEDVTILVEALSDSLVALEA
jgi:4-aminobutyrate aminotransferase-like enzyme